MTHDQLTVAQAEAFTILRDLMHMKADDPRPQRIINTIKQAAMAILRLKPLSPQGEDRSTRQRGAGEGGLHAQHSTPSQPSESTHPRAAEPDDPTAHLSDEKFTELLTHLPDTLEPATDKRRLRLARYLARYNLGNTPEVKAAIRARAHALADALRHHRAA